MTTKLYTISEADTLAINFLVNTGAVSVHQAMEAIQKGLISTEKKEYKLTTGDMENITYLVHDLGYDFDEALKVYQDVIRKDGQVINADDFNV